MTWLLADKRRSELIGDANALAMIADTLSRPCGGGGNERRQQCWQPHHVAQLSQLHNGLIRLQLPE